MATDAQLTLAIIARDKATADLKKVESQLARLQKRHTSFASTAAKSLAVGAVVAYGAASVKAFADAEKSQARLELAYKKFPALAGTSIDSLRALNSEMQAKVGVDDDALASAQAVLAQFRLTGSQIRELTPLLVDYATVTGQDVTTAAGSLGKAFMGNAKALKAIGINFKATGDTARDFETVMAALEEKVGGAGEAFGGTTAGQLARLDAQFGDLQETVGEALVPALQGLVSVATPLAKAAGAIPAPVRSAAIAATALGVAALVAGPRVLSMRNSIIQAQVAAGKAPAAMGKYAGALKAVGVGAATAAVALPVIGSIVDKIGDSMFGTTTQAVDLKDSLSKIATTGKVEGLGQFGDGLKDIGSEIEHLANPGLSQRVEDFFGTLAGNGGGEGRNRVLEQVQQIDQALTEMVSSGNATGAAKALAALEQSAQDAGAPAGALTELLTGYSAASKEAARDTTDFGDATKGSAEKVLTLKDRISGLKDALSLLGGATRTNEGATIALQAAMDAAAAAVKENGKGLDVTSEKGRANRQVLMDLASTALESAGAWATNGKSVAYVSERTVEARASFIKTAMAMGLSEVAAGKLADSYGLIPKEVATRAIARGFGDAKEKAEELKRKLDAINKNILIQIHTRYDGAQVPSQAAPRPGGWDGDPSTPWPRASGGPVFGPGTATSDSIPAMLSNGEYVINARSAKRIGYGNLDRLNRYADGGKVSKKRSAAREALADLLQQRRDAVGSITSSLLGAVGLGAAFDPGKYRDLLDALKTAGDAVIAAQEKVNEARAAKVNASGPTEMAAALKAEAEASRELAAAKTAESAARKQAENAKPTAKNVRKGLHSLAERMRKFASVLKALKRKGLREDLLAQLVEMGPMEGLDEARALNAGSAKDIVGINADQASIVKTARAIGRFGAHAQYDPLIRAQRNVINGSGSAEPVFVSKTVVQVDGKTIVEAAQRYKRANGNKPVGLG